MGVEIPQLHTKQTMSRDQHRPLALAAPGLPGAILRAKNNQSHRFAGPVENRVRNDEHRPANRVTRTSGWQGGISLVVRLARDPSSRSRRDAEAA